MQDQPVGAKARSGAKKAGHKNVLLRVEREGNTRFVALPMEAG